METHATKLCSKCGQTLPLGNFTKDASKRDGLSTVCRTCRKVYAQAYYEQNKDSVCAKAKLDYKKNREKKLTYQSMWRENHPGYMDEYRKKHPYDQEERRRQYELEDKAEAAARAREYRKLHCSEINAKNRKRYSEDPDYRARVRGQAHSRDAKMRELPRGFTANDWKRAVDFFGNQCAYCGKNVPLEQDHLVSLKSGGGYTPRNIIPACKSCNSSKGAKKIEIWFPQQFFYTEKAMSLISKWVAEN